MQDTRPILPKIHQGLSQNPHPPRSPVPQKAAPITSSSSDDEIPIPADVNTSALTRFSIPEENLHLGKTNLT